MEFTQPLGVGLGLAVRINNHSTVTQYVWEDAQTLMQQSTIHGKYHGKTGYLLRNVDMGIWEFMGTGYHVDDMQTMQMDESQMMTSCRSHTNHDRLIWLRPMGGLATYQGVRIYRLHVYYFIVSSFVATTITLI